MMQANKAEKILREFEAVIKTEEKEYGTVLPDGRLPYSRIMIKGAIKSFAAHLHHNKELGGEMVLRLKAGYAMLGRFTSTEEADFVKEYKATAATHGNTGFADKSKRFQFIMNKVRIQEEDHTQEFKVFFSRLVNDKILGEPS